MTLNTSLPSDLAEATKARLRGGLLGNFSIAFCLFNWRVVLMALGDQETNIKIDFIADYLGKDCVYVYCAPIAATAAILIIQYLSTLLLERIGISLGNSIHQMRVRSDATGDKLVNDLRVVLCHHILRVKSKVEALHGGHVDGDRSAMIEDLNAMMGHIRPDAAHKVPQVASVLRESVRKSAKVNRNLACFDNI